MKSFKKIAPALLLGALVSGSAQAQISNTVYFQKNNFRTHYVNPAMAQDCKFYMGTPVPFIPVPVLGTMAMGLGNNSFCFADVIKNVEKNGVKKSVFCLDSSVPNGQQNFLDEMANVWNVNAEMKMSVIDFGFRVKERNYFSFSANLNLNSNVYIPKQFFSMILDGMDYKDPFSMNINKFGFNAHAYADFGLGYTRVVNDKLNVGGTLKLLKGVAAIKSKFKDIDLIASADEWTMSGDADIYMSIPTVGLKLKSNGEFKDFVDDFDNFESKDLTKGNWGVGLDLGASYRILPKLNLSASLIDFGFIRYKNWASKLNMQQDFHFDGASLDIKSQKVDFDELEDSFTGAFYGENDAKFNQYLASKVYLGAEYDLTSWFGVAALSKTQFAGRRISEEFSLQGQLHFWRLLSATVAYNVYDHQWNSLSAGANLNLGPFNIFAAVDNLPARLSKVNGDFSIPAHLQYVRVNVGFGFTIGAKKKKDKDTAAMAEELAEADFFDADGDGVQDSDDKCSDTPVGIEVDANGCPLDADRDGVPDYLDKCASTPEGVAVDENGCPLDADGDGVPDYLDKCPDTPEGMPVDMNGCSIDDDGDGVTDALDKCPDTPSGVAVDSNGCPVDTDGDGVPDYLDKCPDVKGVASNNGCPEVKKEVQQLFRRALNGIQFQTGSSTILRSSYSILDEIAKTMIQNPNYKLNISGHTDNVGNADLNLKLSKDRAASVVKYLLNKNISADRLHSEGYGDTKPLVPNTTSANRAKNRRVEFEIEFIATVEE